MKRKCGQDNIPEVDNSALMCDSYTSSKCVFLEDVRSFSTDRLHSSLNDYIINQEKVITDLRKSNLKLKSEIDILKNENRRMLSEFKTLQIRVSNIKIRK